MTISSTPGAAATATDLALDAALDTVRRNIALFGEQYPDDTTTNGRYELRPATAEFSEGSNRGWTTSFWSGMKWLGWLLTEEDVFRRAAAANSTDFARRVFNGEDLDTHDLGFLYTLSTIPAWRLLEDETSRDASLLAADHLMRRLLEPAGIIQAWGDLTDPHQRGRTIVDSLMNMPLLTWASEQTGDLRYADAVRRHTTALEQNVIRPDDSTFHTFYWDLETGKPLRGATEQGAHDESCWARGQAWGIYGFALNYRATGNAELLDAAWRCANYFLAHLPADSVPFWDLAYTEGSDAPRDSSSAAIAACGLLELARLEPDEDRATQATAAATAMLTSLIENYTPATSDASDALLLHGVYDLPKNKGVDEGTLWGDYFYLEALMRVSRPEWTPFW